MDVFTASEKHHPKFNQALSRWAAKIIFGDSGEFGPCCSLAVSDKNKLIAVVIYHNYHPEHEVIELSMAGVDRRWMTRPVLARMFAHAFNNLSCQMVVVRIDPKSHLHRMARSYGFQGYEVPRLRGRTMSEWIYTLTDDEWRSRGGETSKYRTTPPRRFTDISQDQAA